MSYLLPGQVAISPLNLQILVNGEALRLVGYPIFSAIKCFIQREEPCFYRQHGRLYCEVLCHPQPVAQGSENVKEFCTLNVFCLFNLVHEILRIAYRGCSSIGYPVSSHDLHNILFLAGLPRRGNSPCAFRGCRACLNAGIHIGLIVEAYVDVMFVAIHRSREGLEPYVKVPPSPANATTDISSFLAA